MNDPLNRRLGFRPELELYDVKSLDNLKMPPKRQAPKRLAQSALWSLPMHFFRLPMACWQPQPPARRRLFNPAVLFVTRKLSPLPMTPGWQWC